MTQTGTIADLIDLSIAIERITESVYSHFVVIFADVPEIATFWRRYAQEETGHANWMRNLRGRVDPLILAQPADAKIWEMAVHATRVSAEQLVVQIETLQDAFELANEIEHGETNAIFEFLMRNFSNDEKSVMFLRTQLKDHIGHLMNGLPDPYREISARRAVRARQ